MLFPKKRMGKLAVQVVYSTRHNFSMTVTIRELKLREPITFEGKTFDVPAGPYTVMLKGLLSDPSYEGSYHQVYKGVYGSFERQQSVQVEPDQVTTCTFELPAEQLPVTIRVVAGGVVVEGAEVLIKEVDPNFRVTRKHVGALFYLEPGTYSVVVTHGNALMKEVIHVSERDTEFVMDISKQVALRPELVVVRYRDGRMLKGITEDFAPGVSRFTLVQENGARVPVDGFAGMKAVFFVKSLHGDRSYEEQKDFAIASQFGRKTVVVFYDKDEVWGYTLPRHTEHAQFLLFPVDPKSNNSKVYVVREAVGDIRFS